MLVLTFLWKSWGWEEVGVEEGEEARLGEEEGEEGVQVEKERLEEGEEEELGCLMERLEEEEEEELGRLKQQEEGEERLVGFSQEVEGGPAKMKVLGHL